MKRTAIFVAVGVVLVAGAAGAYVKHRHHAHVKHHARHLLAHAKPAQLKHHAGHRLALVKHHPNNHLRRVVYRETAPLNCLPGYETTETTAGAPTCTRAMSIS